MCSFYTQTRLQNPLSCAQVKHCEPWNEDFSYPNWQFPIHNISPNIESKLEAHDNTTYLWPFPYWVPMHRVLTEIVTNTCSKQKVKRRMYLWVLELKGVSCHQAELLKCNIQCTISRPRKHWIIFTRSSWQNNFFLLFRIGFPQTGPHQSHENYAQANASLEERPHDDGVNLGSQFCRQRLDNVKMR